MKTTTTYTERLTITTDDDGARAITRTSYADTCTEYLFRELDEAAKRRAISDAIEEEKDTYYSDMYFCSQAGVTEGEILEAARDLENSQPLTISQDQGGSWYGTARGSGWYGHSASWDSVTEAKNTGICFSMDICDAWNAYAARIIALQEGHEDATEQADKYFSIESEANYSKHDAETEEQRAELEAIEANACLARVAYERIAERIEAAAEELTEEAARAVGAVVDGLINEAWDYYQSPEFWREWLDDGETRFTREGERI